MPSLDFFLAVYEIVRLIPKGRVSTYGAIAKALGAPGSARTVGYAMNASHYKNPPVPAHRVLNRKGWLTGKHHFKTPKTMQRLLEKEGHCIVNDALLNFDKVFWDPQRELQG